LVNSQASRTTVVPAQARGAKTAYASGWQMALVRRFRAPWNEELPGRRHIEPM